MIMDAPDIHIDFAIQGPVRQDGQDTELVQAWADFLDQVSIRAQ
jgi:hypothetical protein